MKSLPLLRILFLLALPLAVFSSGSAASLQGQVTEVIDGQSFTLVSQKLPVKIRLIAIAAPAGEQAFADIARQHLADLILKKFVVIRYSALQGEFLLGQVLLGDMDVGAQMIRDGVAWYNHKDERLLSDAEQKIYGQSQEAARNERRGLWQDESPSAPWDFEKARVARATLAASPVLPPTLPRSKPVANKAKPRGLANEDLMGGMIQPGSIAGRPDVKPISSNGSPGRWLVYQPADRHFSILAPSDALEISYRVIDESGQTNDLHSVAGQSNGNVYFIVWTKGPNGNSTDASTANEVADGLVTGFNRSVERSGGFIVTATPGRILRVGEYVGRRYVLTAGQNSGEVRVLSKQIGDNREVFMLCVLNGASSETSGAEFLNSFKIRGASGAKSSEQ
ncbi:MAG TPA: thermonuclease family protein [Pyrinomonadaceae bacterium]|jgi:endonuclease YncB( thermonuclease family)